MPDDTSLSQNGNGAALPAPLPSEQTAGMPLAMRIWFDDHLFNRTKTIAKYIAEAEGFTPPHLINKPQACFAIVVRSLTWRLDPYAVAQATYQTPGGQVGYFGRLCQAIIENSGAIEGGVRFQHYGPWEKVKGKFQIRKSDKGKDYTVPTWTREDAKGCGVKITVQVRGEAEPREWEFDLDQAFPLNSTLWATDPKTQLCYLAVRRFASLVTPGLFMGVPFDREDEAAGMIDVTPPRPTREEFRQSPSERDDAAADAARAEAASGEGEKINTDTTKAKATEQFTVTTGDGEVKTYKRAGDATSLLEKELRHAANLGGQALEGVWESNGMILSQLRETGREQSADMLNNLYRDLIDECDKKERAKREQARQQKDTKEQASPAPTGRAEGARAPAAGEQHTPPATAPAAAQQQASKAAPVDGIVPWSFEHPNYKRPPTSPLKGGNWIAWLPWFVDEIRDMPVEQIADFLSEHNFGQEFDYMAQRRRSDYDEVVALMDSRKQRK